MKARFFSAFVLLFSLCTANFAAAEPIRTIVQLPKKTAKGLVIIAPAKKYLMEERLFAKLSEKLMNDGYITIRFNWDSNTLANPANEQALAEEDLLKVIHRAQARFNMGPRRTAIIAKSFSTKTLYPTLPYAWHYTLMTPNCSAVDTFVNGYGRLLQRTPVPATIVISNEDPHCDVRQIYAALATAPRPLSLFTTYGDHNFVIPKPKPMPKLVNSQVIEIKEEPPKKDEQGKEIVGDNNDYSFQDMVVDFVAAQVRLAI